MSFCGEYHVDILPPKGLGSSPNAPPEVFFHSERSGHLEVGWSQLRVLSVECEVHRVNCNLWLEEFRRTPGIIRPLLWQYFSLK